MVLPMLQEDSVIGLCNYCLHVNLALCDTVHCRLLYLPMMLTKWWGVGVYLLYGCGLMRLGIGFQQNQLATWLRLAFWLDAVGCFDPRH